MRRSNPPRLAVSLLARCLPDDDPLTGDLVEEFSAGRSGLWFWRQTLSAVVASWHRPSLGIRPLRLVDAPSQLSPDPRPLWPVLSGGALTYLSASPVNGIGSLGILAVIVLITVVTPEIWMLVGAALLLGAGLGVVLVRRTAHRLDHEASPADRHFLFDSGSRGVQ